MLAFTFFYKAQGPQKREILRVIATSEGQFYIKRRLWKIIKLHLRSHLSLPRLLHWTDFKTSLEKSRKTWNIPAEQTLFSLPHFHFYRADLSSIVTWVLWDFGGWRRHGSRGPAVLRNQSEGANKKRLAAKSCFHIRFSTPQKTITPQEDSFS